MRRRGAPHRAAIDAASFVKLPGDEIADLGLVNSAMLLSRTETAPTEARAAGAAE